MAKKAQGISMNVIIIAAIALLVLVILSVIFIGRMGRFGTETGSCTSQGGSCTSDPFCPSGAIQRDLTCPEGQICCISVGV